MGDVGQGGQVQFAAESGLAGQIREGEILHDERVGVHVPFEAGREAVGAVHVAGLEQGIHGHMDAAAFAVGQFGQARKLGQAEVFGLHPGRKMLQAEIYGVRSGGQGGQKAGGVPGGGENFRFQRGYAHL